MTTRDIPTRFHDRRPGQRNVGGIIAIAIEGAATGEEHHYFSKLRSLLIPQSQSRYEIYLITDPEHRSSPEDVRARMLEFMQKKKLKPATDAAWLVCDVDNWPMEHIRFIAREASQGHYSLAISNPCFELWLLLHHEGADEEILDADPESRDKSQLLKRKLGSLRNRNSQSHISNLSVESVCAAVQRARRLLLRQPAPFQPLPPYPGTFVHRIIESIVALQLFPTDQQAFLAQLHQQDHVVVNSP